MLKNFSAQDFEKFLITLGKDRDQAAAKYLSLRERLERFFEWRNCEDPEELTDTVFDRVVKKINDGEEIKNAEAYCVSVAKFVLLENRREALRKKELDPDSAEVNSVEDDKGTDESDDLKNKRFKCLDECLAEFPTDKKKLLISYFDTDEKTLIPKRKGLAEKIGINLNTLRIRVSRLKSKLEKCTKECCEKNGHAG